MLAMTSADQVRRVLQDAHHDDIVIEDLDDGGALVRDPHLMIVDDVRRFPVSETLARCADLLSESGFAVAMVRDERGVYLNAR